MELLSIEEWKLLRNAAFKEVEKYPFIRIGQALFNILCDGFPELAESVSGTTADPFQCKNYTDQRIKNFYDKIVKTKTDETK